jgi:UDP-N-acetylmuramate--alanine ligase
LNLDKKYGFYFVGIGGIGMSALARWFKKQGKFVAGYDRTETPLTQQLQEEGIEVTYEDFSSTIPEKIKDVRKAVLVVYTPAIPSDSQILNYFKDHKYKIKKRSEVLGAITKKSFTIAVAGTHGKTTTSALIAHILKETNQNMVAFLGGILQNYESNLIINRKSGQELNTVVEADEYDRSFLTLSPDIAVITALDPDHLDIYGELSEMQKGFRDFVNKLKKKGTLIIYKGLYERVIPEDRPDIKVREYGLSHIPVRAENIRLEKEEVRFDYHSPAESIENIPLSLPGFHNIENAIAAITVCLKIGIDGSAIKAALSSFRGIKRRFEYVLYTDNLVFIDDYAHHPEEIKALLSSLRAIFEGHKITALFQPHLYSRTRDFADEFAEALDLADEVLLMDIYPAREKPIKGVGPELILDKMHIEKKSLCSKIDVIEELDERDLDILITIGAGDIDQLVEPIKILLSTKYEISQN